MWEQRRGVRRERITVQVDGYTWREDSFTPGFFDWRDPAPVARGRCWSRTCHRSRRRSWMPRWLTRTGVGVLVLAALAAGRVITDTSR